MRAYITIFLRDRKGWWRKFFFRYELLCHVYFIWSKENLLTLPINISFFFLRHTAKVFESLEIKHSIYRKDIFLINWLISIMFQICFSYPANYLNSIMVNFYIYYVTYFIPPNVNSPFYSPSTNYLRCGMASPTHKLNECILCLTISKLSLCFVQL